MCGPRSTRPWKSSAVIDLTPERLAELRALAAAATPGPWEAEGETRYDYFPPATSWRIPDLERWSVYTNDVGFGEDEATARYVAAVDPDVVTALVDEVERLRAALMVGNRMMGSMAGPTAAADEALWESFELTLADLANDGTLVGQAEATSEEERS